MPIISQLPESIVRRHRGLMDERAYFAGAKLAFLKQAGDTVPTSSLAGRLYVSATGWGLLSVPNAFVRGVFDALDEHGVELPLREGKLEAHISVFRKEEVDKIGGPDKISERGHSYRYNVGQLKTVNPSGWDDVSKVYLIEVQSPELKALRRSYGLTPLPNGDHEFHITVAVVRKHVLKSSPVSKAAADVATDPELERRILKLLGAGTVSTGLAGTAGARMLERYFGDDEPDEPRPEPESILGRINRRVLKPTGDAAGAVLGPGVGALAGLVGGNPLIGAGAGLGVGALTSLPGMLDEGGPSKKRFAHNIMPGLLSGGMGGALSWGMGKLSG